MNQCKIEKKAYQGRERMKKKFVNAVHRAERVVRGWFSFRVRQAHVRIMISAMARFMSAAGRERLPLISITTAYQR